MTIIVGDARALPLAAASVDCIVTSPPYNVGVDYGTVDDDIDPAAYVEFARICCAQFERVLKPGGRAWVNVAVSTGGQDGGLRTKLATLWDAALEASGLTFRDWIVWDKVGGEGGTRWGSYLSPNSPNLRGRYELVLLYFKGPDWKRGRTERSDIDPDEWPHLTRNVWPIQPEPRNHGHPAPFPRRIPRKAILLSTWPGDIVLDPFCGSGTTVRVAHDLGRVGIGVELSAAYARAARRRTMGTQGAMIL